MQKEKTQATIMPNGNLGPPVKKAKKKHLEKREDIITEVLKITTPENLKSLTENKHTWNTAEYRQHQKNLPREATNKARST